MKRTTIIGVALALLAVSAVAEQFDDWKYDGKFHELVAKADRLVIRNGGYNCCGPVDKQEILLSITNRGEISKLNALIQFKTNQTWNACMCCGYPGIDWYTGKQRIALTALHHGHAIRWKGFPGDAQLTPASSMHLVEWLATHGITGPKNEIEAGKRRAAIAKEARAILEEFVPQGFLVALERAEDEATENGPKDMFASIDAENVLKDKYIRASFENSQVMYASLFRIMGCLSMHWDSRFSPEQYETYEFIVRALRDELDAAFRAAAISKDQIERRGAARMVYSQHYMTNHGKTEQDIAEWMGILAEAAYTDPFPENRRLIMHRLKEFPNAGALDVLKLAVEDPDAGVRRKALAALAVMKTPERQNILQQVAQGQTHPRSPSRESLPKNYAEGCGSSYSISGMDAQAYTESDAEAAKQALQDPVLFEDLGNGVTKRTWYHKDGTKWCEAYLLNGKSHGTYTEWWPDGTVKRTIEWRDDKRHGKTAHFDSKGRETKRTWYHRWKEVTEEEFRRREAQSSAEPD